MTKENVRSFSGNEVAIIGGISEDFLPLAKKWISDKAASGAPRLTCHMSGTGGFVTTAFGIGEALQSYPGETLGMAYTEAGSALGVFSLYFKCRVASHATRFHFHNVRAHRVPIDVFRNPDKCEQVRQALEPIQEEMERVLSERSGLSRGDVREICERDRPMSGSEAYELGIVDDLVSQVKLIRYFENRNRVA